VRARVADHARVLDSRTTLFLAEHREELSKARELLARAPTSLLKQIGDQRGLLDRFEDRAAAGRKLVASEIDEIESLSKQLRLGARRLLTTHRHNWARGLDKRARELTGGAGKTLRRESERLEHQREGRGRGADAQRRALHRRAEGLIAVYRASLRGWPVGPDGRLITDYDQASPGYVVRLLYPRGELELAAKRQHPYPED
jgi:hypothetical protein